MTKGISLRLLALLVLVCLAGACNTFDGKHMKTASLTPSKNTGKESVKAPVYHKFKDILVPGDFTENKKYSAVTETAGMTTGFMSFYGPVEAASAANFFSIKMIMDGWKHVTYAKSSLATVLIFNKGKRWCTVELSETDFTTDLRISVSLEIMSPESASKPAAGAANGKDDLAEPSGLIEPSGVIEE
jgi:hypothetical protein